MARALDPVDGFSPRDAVIAAGVEDLELVLHPRGGVPDGPVLVVGMGASPGVASGVAVFDPWRALDLIDAGTPVILVRTTTSPADETALAMASGVVTSGGGMSSHAAVVARGRGLPAVCGAGGLTVADATATTRDGRVLVEGEVISIDGTSGEVRLGSTGIDSDAIPAEAEALLAWADEARAGEITILANADTAADATRALAFGAEGIGLCRTEHLFMGDERLALIRAMILASGGDAEAAALGAMQIVQRTDFEALLAVMDDMSVTVRLLDLPLHEFLPDVIELEVLAARGELSEAGAELLVEARRWREQNPMLGVRGVRLAVLRPALYRMQVRALCGAILARIESGGHPSIRVLVPMVATSAEFEVVRSWLLEEVAAFVADHPGTGMLASLEVGAMVETPRAALRAGELARHADFLSLGTNDLTQMTFGFSRDDVARVLESYIGSGLLAYDPFVELDSEGVGELVTLAVQRAREVRPELAVGVCGEHGGDPRSIRFFHEAGLTSVSCSPFRVPIARLAAAQAVIEARGTA